MNNRFTRPIHGGYPNYDSLMRVPWVLMSLSECTEVDMEVMKKLVNSGAEIVVVQDKDFEFSLDLLLKKRKQTYGR